MSKHLLYTHTGPVPHSSIVSSSPHMPPSLTQSTVCLSSLDRMVLVTDCTSSPCCVWVLLCVFGALFPSGSPAELGGNFEFWSGVTGVESELIHHRRPLINLHNTLNCSAARHDVQGLDVSHLTLYNKVNYSDLTLIYSLGINWHLVYYLCFVFLISRKHRKQSGSGF